MGTPYLQDLNSVYVQSTIPVGYTVREYSSPYLQDTQCTVYDYSTPYLWQDTQGMSTVHRTCRMYTVYEYSTPYLHDVHRVCVQFVIPAGCTQCVSTARHTCKDTDREYSMPYLQDT
jgi:hypothetical protein